MDNYINFNNLRKKKGLVSGVVVVGWSSPLWKHKKQLGKHKKKKKIRKTIYYLNNEKNNKNVILLFSKK